MKVEQFFCEHPVFRHEECANWKASMRKVNPISINTALRYYVKTSQIKLIRRKLYAVILPNQSPETVIIDPYLIAGKATDDAMLGYHTVLALMGIAYSTLSQFTYITTQKVSHLRIKSNGFNPLLYQQRNRKNKRHSCM